MCLSKASLLVPSKYAPIRITGNAINRRYGGVSNSRDAYSDGKQSYKMSVSMSENSEETFCYYCQEDFKTPEKLGSHIERKHPGTYAGDRPVKKAPDVVFGTPIAGKHRNMWDY